MSYDPDFKASCKVRNLLSLHRYHKGREVSLQSEAEGHAAYLLRLDASTFPLQYQTVYQCYLQTTQYIRTQPLVQHQADDTRLDYQVPSVATV